MICDDCEFLRTDRVRVPYGDTTATISEVFCYIDADPEACERDKEDKDVKTL